MAEKYKDKIKFLLVYVREAHADDEAATISNRLLGIHINTAANFEEKEEHATLCVRKLDIQFDTVVDNFDAKVEKAYGGHPDRLYLVSKDGRIVMKGEPGPWGFKPDVLEQAIQKEIGGSRQEISEVF
ncbi:MAG: hypothetical protein IH846_13900 [Acidobacteria bacterium]|nr:hypothetical protein [Acidobacteriota bacterium]